MKKLLFLAAVFFTVEAHAQNYLISFAGTGLSTVKVQNLATGIFVDVLAGDVLRLTISAGIPEVNIIKSARFKIYPNPMTDISTLELLPPVPGDATIIVCDMTGKVLTQYKGYVENSIQKFRLSGVKNGLYVITVRGIGYQFSEKLLSDGKSNGTPIITVVSNNIQEAAEKKSLMDSKGFQAYVDMAYNTGDILKYTAVSGNNSTVMTDIPTANKTATFNFVACSDGENINYPVVMIGDQVWTAENLRTTKYNDGSTSIPLVIENTAWCELITPGYCWYNNDEASYKATYGALYNWYAVTQGNICPTGWHVPTDADWTTLATKLGGASFAGGKLKETGTSHWKSPNTDATNETGFTALPGGDRTASGGGAFVSIGTGGLWWSTAETGTGNAWCWFMGHAFTQLGSVGDKKQTGYSVRCIMDK